MSERPSIVHVGYPKAASTFLQDYVASHPEVAYTMVTMDPLHDPSFAAMPSPAGRNSSDGRVTFISNEKLAESIVVVGDSLVWHRNKFTPGSWDVVAPHVRLDPLEAAQRVKTSFGVNKALIVVREQVEWLLSAYKYFLPRLPAGRNSFADFCDTPRGRVYLKAGHVDETIAAYRQVFGDGNLCILDTNHLKSDPNSFASALCRFMGVGVRPLPEGRANVGASNLNTLVRRRFPVVDRLPNGLKRFGGTVLKGIVRKELAMFSQREIEDIRSRYAESNRLARQMLQDLERAVPGPN